MNIKVCGVKMILPVNNLRNNNIHFSANENEKDSKLEYTHDTLLKNNIITRTRIGIDKFSNAITLYPAKGLKGNKNANFYEFLTMGTVPYLTGSAMLMAVFNAANKHFAPFARSKAGPLGKKMALGVLFYGLAKEASKTLINTPVKMMTGVDPELPYAKVIYELPDDINDTDITSIEYHKVFESVEFPRWDLLYGDESKGQKRNYYYDKVAKKLGMGNNLNDSDQEVKPRIKEIIIKSNIAKNISSYLWAAAGVGLAFQKPWDNFFNVATLKFWQGAKFKASAKSFGRNFIESCKTFYTGKGQRFKHGGKALLFTALASSILGAANAVSSSNKPSKLDASDIIKKDEKYVVN